VRQGKQRNELAATSVPMLKLAKSLTKLRPML
jgi:hypothetical protein